MGHAEPWDPVEHDRVGEVVVPADEEDRREDADVGEDDRFALAVAEDDGVGCR